MLGGVAAGSPPPVYAKSQTVPAQASDGAAVGPIRPATGFCPTCELTMGLRVVRKGNQNNNTLWLVKNHTKLKSAHKQSDWNMLRPLPAVAASAEARCLRSEGAGPCPGHRWTGAHQLPCPAPPRVPIEAPHPGLLLGTRVWSRRPQLGPCRFPSARWVLGVSPLRVCGLRLWDGKVPSPSCP